MLTAGMGAFLLSLTVPDNFCCAFAAKPKIILRHIRDMIFLILIFSNKNGRRFHQPF